MARISKKISASIRHAFAIEKAGEHKFSVEDQRLLERLASKIKKHGLETPAILFLETLKPLNYIGSQVMVFFRPFISSIFSCHEYDRFTKILEHRSSIEELIRKIEKQ